MKYYLFAGRKEINFNNVKKYMLRIDEAERFAVFCIRDENYTEFRNAMGFSELLAEGIDCWPLLGEDGALYSMNSDGIKKEADKCDFTLETNWKRLCKLTKMLDTGRKSLINTVTALRLSINLFQASMSIFLRIRKMILLFRSDSESRKKAIILL